MKDKLAKEIYELYLRYCESGRDPYDGEFMEDVKELLGKTMKSTIKLGIVILITLLIIVSAIVVLLIRQENYFERNIIFYDCFTSEGLNQSDDWVMFRNIKRLDNGNDVFEFCRFKYRE